MHIIYINVYVLAIITVSSCSKELHEENEPTIGKSLTVKNVSELNSVDIHNVTDLTITGEIQGTDWNILFEMSVLGNLKKLDIFNANITGVHDGSDTWNDDEIPEFNFSDSKHLEEVILPKSLKSIGEEAFSNCKKLKVVQFSNNIDSIAERAFYNTSLTGEFELPNSARVIGRQAFAKTSISRIIITSDVRAVKYSKAYTLYGNSVFADCNQLTEVCITEGCTILELGFEHCENLTKVSLPSTLRTIGFQSGSTANYIFKACKKLESIDLPQNISYIGENAFAKTDLKMISIPNSVKYICEYAFHDCNQLHSIRMSENAIHIGHSCFKGCISLVKIKLPKSLTEIETEAFSNCTSLSEVVWGDNVKYIEEKAFHNCSSLTSIEFPLNLELIGESAFEGCSSLSHVVVNDLLSELPSSTFKNCIELNDLNLGRSLKSIGSNCFYGCHSLNTIEIPRSVQYFCDYTFAYSGLNEIKVSWETPIIIKDNIFGGLNLPHMRLIVPIGTKMTYSTFDVWSNFGDIQESI